MTYRVFSSDDDYGSVQKLSLAKGFKDTPVLIVKMTTRVDVTVFNPAEFRIGPVSAGTDIELK